MWTRIWYRAVPPKAKALALRIMYHPTPMVPPRHTVKLCSALGYKSLGQHTERFMRVSEKKAAGVLHLGEVAWLLVPKAPVACHFA
jgi:hypothetical protein